MKQAKLQPIQVIVNKEVSVEKAIKKLQRKVRDEGVLKEVFLRRAYEKPSEKRKRKSRSRHKQHI
jgi:small subunit ribosomal protein S21